VLNDTLPGPALNGPHSDAQVTRSGRYHLRFNALTGSTYERCVEDLNRLFLEHGLPWFRMYSDPQSLLEHQESPLNADAKKLLREAVAGTANEQNIAASLKLLGINPSVRRGAEA
jgi:hypothetical protein